VPSQTVAILDFGSQYTQLIARRVRELKVHSRIFPWTTSLRALEQENLIGVILSGGPNSVYDEDAPKVDRALFELGVPVLGICYGLQSTALELGAQVERSGQGGEYGRTRIQIQEETGLFAGLPDRLTVWMSHGDRVETLPAGFTILASSDSCRHAAVQGMDGRFFGLQFHPEVTHTDMGDSILRNFLYGVCDAAGDWEMTSFIEDSVAAIRAKVSGEKVVLGLSGGVDSSVAALLIHQAVGDDLECIFVDNCFLREKEADQVISTFRDHFKITLHAVDASERFLDAIAGISDPE
jgi:GMP synthase (glutamine-hydrolysing)